MHIYAKLLIWQYIIIQHIVGHFKNNLRTLYFNTQRIIFIILNMSDK